MKKIHLITAAALTTTLLAGGMTAFAEENRDITTDNTIRFVPNEEEDVIVQPPVVDPEITPPTPVPPGQTGPLTLAYAPRLMSFGEQVISTRDMAYNMIAETQTQASNGEEIPYVSFAQVQDTRGTHDGWDLSVALTDFLSGTNVLTGAQIEFVNPTIVYPGVDQTQAPAAVTNQGDSLVLIPGGATLDVMTADDGEGAGTSTIMWGDQANLLAQAADEDVDVVENQAIKLHVPGNSNQNASAYTATMTWTLSSVADGNGETEPEPAP